MVSNSIQRSARPAKRAARAWLRRAAITAAGLAVAGTIAYGWLPRRVVVEVGAARIAPLAVEVAEDGQTRVRDRFVVAAPITGTLERIAIEAGAPV
ncbi:MAG TPA: hypothetical protein VFP84_07515, partial [Kofleriaceae bacterium]|nr:hypothetical protein [Kofleriaceae bacterium]